MVAGSRALKPPSLQGFQSTPIVRGVKDRGGESPRRLRSVFFFNFELHRVTLATWGDFCCRVIAEAAVVEIEKGYSGKIAADERPEAKD
jgi:hypothetical protein